MIRTATCQPANKSCFVYTSMFLTVRHHCCKADSNITICCQILTNVYQVMVCAPISAWILRDLIAVNALLGSSWIQMGGLAQVYYSWWTRLQLYLRQERSTGNFLFVLSYPASFTSLWNTLGQIPHFDQALLHEALYRRWVDCFLLKRYTKKPLTWLRYRSQWMFAESSRLPAKV